MHGWVTSPCSAICRSVRKKAVLNAIVLLYRQILNIEFGKLDFDGASNGRRLPVVFTREEATAVIDNLCCHHRLLVSVMYGSGLRAMDAGRLRVQDVHFGHKCILFVKRNGRSGIGHRYRTLLWPLCS